MLRIVNNLLVQRIAGICIAMLSLGALAWAGPYHILYTFAPYGRADEPVSGLTLDSHGNAYGVTNLGGYNNFGTVYELSPTTGFHIIHAFNGSDGGNPFSNLAIDPAGNLYGTAPAGGIPTCTQNGGCGVVFELSPPNGDGPWKFTTLYSFSGQDDGFSPLAGVVFDSQGNLYGTAAGGGTFGCGVAFELSPANNSQWSESVLYAFGEDGCLPNASLVFDTTGNLYGTTLQGGISDAGVVFELSPSLGNWTYDVLHEFNSNVKDGTGPRAPLAVDSAGSLYGTTFGGGKFGWGTVFELTPNGGTWTETILHNFAGGQSDGAQPLGSVVLDDSGLVYGTASLGGGNPGVGSVFRLKPNGNGTWDEEQFFFGTGALGGQPVGSLLLNGGFIYGTTRSGGKLKNGENGDGVVFKLNTGQSNRKAY